MMMYRPNKFPEIPEVTNSKVGSEILDSQLFFITDSSFEKNDSL